MIKILLIKDINYIKNFKSVMKGNLNTKRQFGRDSQLENIDCEGNCKDCKMMQKIKEKLPLGYDDDIRDRQIENETEKISAFKIHKTNEFCTKNNGYFNVEKKLNFKEAYENYLAMKDEDDQEIICNEVINPHGINRELGYLNDDDDVIKIIETQLKQAVDHCLIDELHSKFISISWQIFLKYLQLKNL